jgi:TetR/AcrR family transcriptional regulator, copper-responsive repressor
MVQKEESDVAMPASAAPKLRGRPKAYDRDAALKAMRQVFWAKGFSATSLDDMSAATGMNRPSLYAAFGDKTEAFRAVLKDYIDDARPLYMEAFRATAPLRESLMKVYETSIAIYHNPQAQGMGCFMIGAALTDVKRDAQVGEMILGALKDMEVGFIRRFEKARDAGELPADADIKALARIASSGHNTISVRMRAGESIDDIRQYLTQMVDVIVR